MPARTFKNLLIWFVTCLLLASMFISCGNDVAGMPDGESATGAGTGRDESVRE